MFPVFTDLKINGKALSESLLHLRDGICSMSIEHIEVADTVLGEVWASHRSVESVQAIQMPMRLGSRWG